MCGFLGIYAPAAQPLSPGEIPAARAAAQRLAHRGNTSHGEMVTAREALFHHRLAFRGLSDGQQPMTDAQGRATIVFNGELYGYQPLRDRLAARYDFRSRADTEVILAAYLEYGEEMLAELDGEFAFVITDHRTGKLYAARDAFGVKPLFWNPGAAGAALREYREHYAFDVPDRLHFASEMKGLGLPLRWDPRGLDRLFLSLYEETGTSFEGIHALVPGALLVADPRESGWHCRIGRKILKRVAAARTRDSFESRAEQLRELVATNVQNKLDAEVPLGAYLSGGIDSRIAAYEMSKSGAKIETFTVGFEGADYDETPAVKEFLAAYPNLRGRALRTSEESLTYAYPHALYASEFVQPYTNGAAKWWLSRFARRHVRGVLTGDGADELFCGYPSYRYLAWWNFHSRHPSAARARLFDERVVGRDGKFWEKGLSSRPDGADLEASVATLGWAHPLYAQVTATGTLWAGKRLPLLLAGERENMRSFAFGGSSPLGTWRDYFLHTHFPAHVLNWVGDRMEMANTLEGRPIFLSRALLEFARTSPDAHLVRGMRDKAVLRRAYREKLGNFSRAPKKQFNAPFLQGSLGREFLSAEALRETGLIDPAQLAAARSVAAGTDPLAASFARIFLQNCLVTQMLDRYLVRGQAPTRDPAYEERFLDERTEDL